MASIEWVYLDPENDEPHVLEADSSSRVGPCRIFRIDDSDVASDQTEAICFGDVDSGDDEPVGPVQAFEIFAGRRFPTSSSPDFSDMIFCEDHAMRNLSRTRRQRLQTGSSNIRKLPMESRAARIDRLRIELSEVLSGEPVDGVDGGSHGMAQLDELRLALDRLAAHAAHASRAKPASLFLRSDRQFNAALVKDSPGNDNVYQTSSSQHCNPVFEVFCHDSVSVSALDQRVTSLERQLTPGLDLGSKGLWDLVNSVRVYLGAADPVALNGIRTSVDSMVSVMAGREVAQVSDLAGAWELLSKLDNFEVTAAAVPTLIVRLRSIKASLDDASSISRAVAELSAKCDSLTFARNENSRLLSQIEENLAVSLRTVQSNMNTLHDRLCTALQDGA
jgi:hypothetical protein